MSKSKVSSTIKKMAEESYSSKKSMPKGGKSKKGSKKEKC